MTFFEPGTRVLAYHGPLVYEAKVMQSFEIGKKVVVDSEGKELPIPEKLLEKNLQSSNAYLLHYKGWKSKWDEWVEQARVLDYSEESLALQKELKQRVTKAKQPPPASDETTKKRSKTKTTGSTLPLLVLVLYLPLPPCRRLPRRPVTARLLRRGRRLRHCRRQPRWISRCPSPKGSSTLWSTDGKISRNIKYSSTSPLLYRLVRS